MGTFYFYQKPECPLFWIPFSGSETLPHKTSESDWRIEPSELRSFGVPYCAALADGTLESLTKRISPGGQFSNSSRSSGYDFGKSAGSGSISA